MVDWINLKCGQDTKDTFKIKSKLNCESSDWSIFMIPITLTDFLVVSLDLVLNFKPCGQYLISELVDQLKEHFTPETTRAYFIVDWDTINTILGSFWH